MEVNGIDIEIEYKNIKNMHLAVYPPEGRVHVSAPLGYSEEQIRFYVLKKWVWISMKQDELSSFIVQPKRDYVSGEAHYYKGQLYRLRVNIIPERNVAQHVEIDGDYLMLYVRDGSTREQKEEVLFSWYRQMV